MAAPRSTDPTKAAAISFQNLEGARQRVQDLFGLDSSTPLQAEEWALVVRCFKKRHVIAHKLGVMDEQYVQSAGDPEAVAGRKVRISKEEVQELGRLLARIADYLTAGLGI